MLSGNELKIHIVGIGGAGMSAIAVILLQMGHRVSGSDLKSRKEGDSRQGTFNISLLKILEDMGVEIFTGHNEKNIGDANLLAISTAVPKTNAEVEAAKSRDVPVLSRSEILEEICSLKDTIAIAGSHGKTTTAAMLATALKSQEASWIFGGQFQGGEIGAHWNAKGRWLIVEADESDATFLNLPRKVAVITSTDADHIEQYGSIQRHKESYFEFAKATDGVAVCNTDDKTLLEMSGQLQNIVSFGTRGSPDFLIENIHSGRDGATADLLVTGGDTKEKKIKIEIPIPGNHNILNAAAAVAVGEQLGSQSKKLIKELKKFPGVARRFEIKGSAGGITFIDDYAHLPLEIKETLKAVSGWGRIVCAFQPHRYSRIETLWESYADAFEGCDILSISEIYSAGEARREGISSKLIVNAVLDAHPRRQVAWIPNHSELKDYFLTCLKPGDVFLTLNAGDLFMLGEEIFSDFSQKSEL